MNLTRSARFFRTLLGELEAVLLDARLGFCGVVYGGLVARCAVVDFLDEGLAERGVEETALVHAGPSGPRVLGDASAVGGASKLRRIRARERVDRGEGEEVTHTPRERGQKRQQVLQTPPRRRLAPSKSVFLFLSERARARAPIQ